MRGGSLCAVLTAVLCDETGSTLAEYALLSVYLGAAVIAAVAFVEHQAAGELSATARGWLSVALSPP